MSGRPPASGNDLVQELLGAARAESVPAASRERVARQLGIVLSAAGADMPKLAGDASPREIAPRAELGNRLRLDLGWLGVVSALLVGAPGGVVADGVAPGGIALESVVSGSVASNGIAARARRDGLAEPAARSVEGLPAEASRSAPELLPAALEPMTPAPPAPPAPPAAKRAPHRSASARRTAPADRAGAALAPSTLLEEVRQLDHVRSLLAHEDGTAALAALDRYERTFAAGELRLEARVLRVAGQFAAGHGAAARDLARELLATPGAERYRGELTRRLAEGH